MPNNLSIQNRDKRDNRFLRGVEACHQTGFFQIALKRKLVNYADLIDFVSSHWPDIEFNIHNELRF